MNKKHLKNKALIISSALIIMASTIGGIAYAKYVTSITGTGILSVAKWNFNGIVKRQEDGFLNLGSQTYDASILADGKIAPGTSGSFDVIIDATGTETGVDYTTNFSNIICKPENLYFLVDEMRCDSFDELKTELSGHFDADNPQKEARKTVQWVWDYETTDNGKTKEQNDMQDTIDGENANDFSFKMDIIGTQSQII